MEILAIIGVIALQGQLSYDGGCMNFGGEGNCILPANEYEEYNVALHRVCINAGLDSTLFEDFSLAGECSILQVDTITGVPESQQFPSVLLFNN